MFSRRARLFIGGAFILSSASARLSPCKCAPGDACWPSSTTWGNFNNSIDGKLIATQPLGLPCYPGDSYNKEDCDVVLAGWHNSSFISENPIGLDYPINITCLPVDITASGFSMTTSCSIGSNPHYAVNVTAVEDISATLRFAQENNLRLVIKTTGHDFLGRNDGYGSLEVWLRYFRQGISYQPSYKSSTGCGRSGWHGAAMKLSGGYMWRDVYAAAKEHDTVVVGGGSPTVSCTGGWMQGGGHGPASHTFGLGADQVLEAEVVLANGTVVTANACQNQDLYFAIRGGGPGTYGVVASTTIKAWPQVNATVQNLEIAPRDGNVSAFLDALTVLHQSVPDLMDAGYAGYGHWQVEGQSNIVDNYTTGYTHGIYVFNSTEKRAKEAFKAVGQQLDRYKDALYINQTYTTYSDYWSFYFANSGEYSPVGLMAAAGSRLFDRKSMANYTAVREMVQALAGTHGQYAANTLAMVSGGKVWKDAADIYSGVVPAWRTAYFQESVARILSPSMSEEEKQEVYQDVTFTKVGAMKALAPDTGAYMNEADPNEPDWQENYFGRNYMKLRLIKARYDPSSLFYCPQCVGSPEWESDETGRLCRNGQAMN